jgi:hypothetical protein
MEQQNKEEQILIYIFKIKNKYPVKTIDVPNDIDKTLYAIGCWPSRRLEKFNPGGVNTSKYLHEKRSAHTFHSHFAL